MKGSFRKDCYY